MEITTWRSQEKTVYSFVFCLFVCLVGLVWFGNQLQWCIRQNKRHGINQCKAEDQCSTMGTSRPSLTGQRPPIKREPDPIPYPHRQPPKTTNQSLRNQESCQFRTPRIEKRSRESPKGQSPDRPLSDQLNRTKMFVCLFVCFSYVIVCLLINYNVAFDRINDMATINVRRRTNVAEQGHVQIHTIKKLGPTAKIPKAKITPSPTKMIPQEQRNQSLQTVQEERKTMMETH